MTTTLTFSPRKPRNPMLRRELTRLRTRSP